MKKKIMAVAVLSIMLTGCGSMEQTAVQNDAAETSAFSETAASSAESTIKEETTALSETSVSEAVTSETTGAETSVSSASESQNTEVPETEADKAEEKDVNETKRRAFQKDSMGTRTGAPDGSVQESHQFSVTGKDGTIYSSFELKTIETKPSQMPKAMILRPDKNAVSEANKSMQEIVKNRYIYQKALLNEVVYSILYSASEKPLRERINFKLLDQDLKA